MKKDQSESVSVTAEHLIRGYALALEQCGCLLRDAVLLYESGSSYASAVVLAAFAWEELGRAQKLARSLAQLCSRLGGDAAGGKGLKEP